MKVLGIMTLLIVHDLIHISYIHCLFRNNAQIVCNGRQGCFVGQQGATYLFFKTLCCEDELLGRVLIEKKESKDLDQNTKEKL